MQHTLIALTLAASTVLAAPVMAGGSISLAINAQNADEATAIRTGLTLYQVVNDIKTNGSISQNGINNLAALGQSGSGNVGVIHQDGDNNDASLSQTGNNNSCGIFQFGDGSSANVDQTGNGEACLLIQAGF